MPLFKKVNLTMKGEKVSFNVNIDGNGVFWCQPNDTMMDALGLEDKITGKTFDDVNHKLVDAVHKYNKLATHRRYVIRYRFHFSPYLKDKMPKDVMTEEMWEKTQGVGNDTFYREEVGLRIEWYPLVIKTLGKTIVEMKMRVATEGDVEYVQRYGDLYKDSLCKPYSDLLFFETDKFWNFQGGERFFEIDLTAETLEFFQQIEQSFIIMITKMFEFLATDPKLLMARISKMIETKQNFLLNQ